MPDPGFVCFSKASGMPPQRVTTIVAEFVRIQGIVFPPNSHEFGYWMAPIAGDA